MCVHTCMVGVRAHVWRSNLSVWLMNGCATLQVVTLRELFLTSNWAPSDMSMECWVGIHMTCLQCLAASCHSLSLQPFWFCATVSGHNW